MTLTPNLPHLLKHCRRGVFFGLVLSLASAYVAAETVAIPLGQQGRAWNVETPRTGLSKEQVAQRFGEPRSKSGPVGEPPIYTWDYGQFSVYFESDRVIHAVVKHPEPQAQQQ